MYMYHNSHVHITFLNPITQKEQLSLVLLETIIFSCLLGVIKYSKHECLAHFVLYCTVRPRKKETHKSS